MKKYYWLKRRKPSARLISDYSNPNDLKDRYAPPPTLRFVDLPIDLVDEVVTKTEQESVEAAYAEVERGETTCLPNFAKGVHLVIDDVTVGI